VFAAQEELVLLEAYLRRAHQRTCRRRAATRNRAVKSTALASVIATKTRRSGGPGSAVEDPPGGACEATGATGSLCVSSPSRGPEAGAGGVSPSGTGGVISRSRSATRRSSSANSAAL